ncbi:hypothetical protein [Escherichia phage ZCEC12]|nr:hypothetical protein [Escherichia phage ZCEC11]UJQ87969.1 hypothetical protein [Escherichia phage ZCEC12]
MRALVAILGVFIRSYWLPCSVNIVNSYAIKLHKVSGTESGTNKGRDKAGQHPRPAPDGAAWRGAGQRDSTPVFQTRRGVNGPPRLRLHKIRGLQNTRQQDANRGRGRTRQPMRYVLCGVKNAVCSHSR